jgi:hypothetical protein
MSAVPLEEYSIALDIFESLFSEVYEVLRSLVAYNSHLNLGF